VRAARDRALLEEGFAFIRALQALGDLVAVEVLGASLENGEQYQGDKTGIEILLELASLTIIHLPVLWTI